MTLQEVKQRFGIIGSSALLENALNTAIRVADTDLSVLITGASGVGKEVFSKIIHDLSLRKHAPFIAVNCGAIPEGTINSELFGHERGAFTSATEARKGYFETADGGTIFLDEIGEMPLDTQAMLLRILENGEFLRVGSSAVRKTNVRIIAATNVSLLDNMQQRKFREDLYYRLATVPIRVPALRERKEDIYPLFRKFARDFADKYRAPPVQLSNEARALLENYGFPGNIRQLKNITEQISVLVTEKMINANELLSFLPPENTNNRMPSVQPLAKEPTLEREILYKILFDLKRDMSELKKWVYQLVKDNDLQVPSNIQLLAPSNDDYSHAQAHTNDHFSVFENNNDTEDYTPSNNFSPKNVDSTPIIINQNTPQNTDFQSIREKEDSLSIENMEKETIRRALKKHKNRRREAAAELGISERTLYRKISQYGIHI